MTIVIVLGGIDVSVGGILAVAAICIGRTWQAGLPEPWSWLSDLVVGGALGALNGAVIAYTRTPPITGAMYIFIATLFLVIGGTWISGSLSSLSFLVRGAFLALRPGPGSSPWSTVSAGCSGACRGTTRCGGGLRRRRRASRRRVERVKIGAYACWAFLAGVAAVRRAPPQRRGQYRQRGPRGHRRHRPGGASIRGGVGSLLGALLGVLFIKLMQNGLVLIGVSSLWETVVIGGLLLVVLATDGGGTSRRGAGMTAGRWACCSR